MACLQQLTTFVSMFCLHPCPLQGCRVLGEGIILEQGVAVDHDTAYTDSDDSCRSISTRQLGPDQGLGTYPVTGWPANWLKDTQRCSWSECDRAAVVIKSLPAAYVREMVAATGADAAAGAAAGAMDAEALVDYVQQQEDLDIPLQVCTEQHAASADTSRSRGLSMCISHAPQSQRLHCLRHVHHRNVVTTCYKHRYH